MSLLVPLDDKLVNLVGKVRLVLEVGDAEPLALQNAEPLLDLIHPRAMDRCEVESKTRTLREPRSHLFAVMGRDVVEDEMNRRDLGRNFGIEMFEKRDVLLLTFAIERFSVDPAAAGIESGEQLERAAPLVLVLDTIGEIPHECGFGCMGARSRLKRGLFVDREHGLAVAKRARVEGDDLFDALVELGVAGRLGAQPHVGAPGFQLVRGKNALDRGG